MKRILIVAAGLLAVVALLLVVAVLLWPGERMAAEITSVVAGRTGADVESGSVGLRILGGAGLSLADGRIAGTGAALQAHLGSGGSIQRYEISYARLDVVWDLAALVRRRTTVTGIMLSGATLTWETVNGRTWTVRDCDLKISGLDVGGGLAGTGDHIPANLVFEWSAAAGEITGNGAVYRSTVAKGDLRDRQLAVRGLETRVGSGEALIDGVVDFREEPTGVADWELTLDGVPAADLLAPYLPDLATRLTCELNGEAAGRLALRDAETRRRTLVAEGRLTSRGGVLKAEDWLAEAGPYLGDRQDLMTVEFDRLDHAFRVGDGRYHIDELALDGTQTDWQAAGWLGFAGDLALRVGVRLPAGFTPDLGAMSFFAEGLRDDEGRVRLGLQLSGRTAAPRLGLDLGSLRGGR